MGKTLTTADQAVMHVFAILRDRGVKAATGMTGNIYPLNGPLSSDKEDIIISVLALNAEQGQNGMLNVNIHVPNLTLPNGDNTQPNRPRFNEIGNRVLAEMDYHNGHAFNLTLDNAGLLVEDKGKWFLNIRVRYNSIRLDNN